MINSLGSETLKALEALRGSSAMSFTYAGEMQDLLNFDNELSFFTVLDVEPYLTAQGFSVKEEKKDPLFDRLYKKGTVLVYQLRISLVKIRELLALVDKLAPKAGEADKNEMFTILLERECKRD